MLKQILSATKIVLLAIVLSFGLSYALAWTSPTATPPGANVAAPLNASATDQTKTGGITAGSLTTTGLTTTGTLKVTTGAGAAKVLTSDASGNATWQAGGSTIDPSPIGSIVSYAGAAAPSGYLICNGAAISRTTYATLFTAIGTTYGAGNGSTTFNLPDLRGEFIRGLDGGRGVDAGRVLGSWQVDLFKSHTHTINNVIMLGGGYLPYSNIAGPQVGTTNATGGSETRPRNVAMNYIIKAVNNSEMVLMDTMSGDNLGNHTATQALNMAGNGINSAGNIMGTGVDVGGAGGLSSYIVMRDTDQSPNGIKYIHANSNVIGFLGGSGNWLSYWGEAGDQYNTATVNATDVYLRNSGQWMSTIASGQLGVGQTWQNVKASRAFNVTYTNSTGKPIFVSLAVFGNNGGSMVTMYVNGIWVGETGGATLAFRDQLSAIVPAGSTYLVTNNSNGTIDAWAELR